jgi:hypothetical protein
MTKPSIGCLAVFNRSFRLNNDPKRRATDRLNLQNTAPVLDPTDNRFDSLFTVVGYNTGQSPELQPNAELVPSAAIFDPLSKSREHSV